MAEPTALQLDPNTTVMSGNAAQAGAGNAVFVANNNDDSSSNADSTSSQVAQQLSAMLGAAGAGIAGSDWLATTPSFLVDGGDSSNSGAAAVQVDSGGIVSTLGGAIPGLPIQILDNLMQPTPTFSGPLVVATIANYSTSTPPALLGQTTAQVLLGWANFTALRLQGIPGQRYTVKIAQQAAAAAGTSASSSSTATTTTTATVTAAGSVSLKPLYLEVELRQCTPGAHVRVLSDGQASCAM